MIRYKKMKGASRLENTKNEKHLREYIRIMERKLGILSDTEMSCCGVTMAQCHAIVEIGRAGSISLNELADILNLDNSTMSRTVNNLVNNGLAKRDADPDDRRYVTISLTGNGAKIFEGIETRMNKHFDRIFESIPQDKREQVFESLEILIDVFKKHGCC